MLASSEGRTNVEAAQRLGIDRSTVRRWRNRFAEYRCDGLLDESRPGRPRVVGDDQIEALITATLETTPPNATRWSTRSMAEHLGLSQSMVSRVWRAFGLAPHKQDPLFVEKVRDIVRLYLNPPERAMVFCVDEKTQIQALNRTQPVFPMLPGTGTGQPRLRALRNLQSLRRPRPRYRQSDRLPTHPAQISGVPSLPQKDRWGLLHE